MLVLAAPVWRAHPSLWVQARSLAPREGAAQFYRRTGVGPSVGPFGGEACERWLLSVTMRSGALERSYAAVPTPLAHVLMDWSMGNTIRALVEGGAHIYNFTQSTPQAG